MGTEKNEIDNGRVDLQRELIIKMKTKEDNKLQQQKQSMKDGLTRKAVLTRSQKPDCYIKFGQSTLRNPQIQNVTVKFELIETGAKFNLEVNRE